MLNQWMMKEAADVEPLGYVEEFDMEEASGGEYFPKTNGIK
jgi:hypothetical protein